MKVSFDFWNNYSFRSALLIIVVACLPFTGWLERFDWMIYDKISYWKQFIPDDQIVIIAIDEKSLQTIGRWPWSRRIHAELIDRLRQAGRNVVALDFLMAESDDNDPEGDRLLGLAIARHGAVVLPIAPIVEPDSQKFHWFSHCRCFNVMRYWGMSMWNWIMMGWRADFFICGREFARLACTWLCVSPESRRHQCG